MRRHGFEDTKTMVSRKVAGLSRNEPLGISQDGWPISGFQISSAVANCQPQRHNRSQRMQSFSPTYDYDNDNNVMLGVNLKVIIMSLAILRIYTICSAVAIGKAKWLLHMMRVPVIPLSRSSPVIV